MWLMLIDLLITPWYHLWQAWHVVNQTQSNTRSLLMIYISLVEDLQIIYMGLQVQVTKTLAHGLYLYLQNPSYHVLHVSWLPYPDNKARWAHVGRTWSRQDQRWANVGPTKFAVGVTESCMEYDLHASTVGHQAILYNVCDKISFVSF